MVKTVQAKFGYFIHKTFRDKLFALILGCNSVIDLLKVFCVDLNIDLVKIHFQYFPPFPDINECDQSPCGFNANCTNTNGSYFCECQIGYEGNETNCTGMPVYASSILKYDLGKIFTFAINTCSILMVL